MKKLELEDILGLEDFESQRQQLFEKHSKYLEKYRKIRIGPNWILVFENRQTLWFRVQEVLRITRTTDPKLILNELAIYNRLLPEKDCLQAALIFDPAKTSSDFTVKNINGEMLQLHCGNHSIASNLINSRPEDLTLGNCLWVQFVCSPQHINRLKDPREDVWFSIKSNGDEYTSNPANPDFRESILKDLAN